jgi:hypothetical protein
MELQIVQNLQKGAQANAELIGEKNGRGERI